MSWLFSQALAEEYSAGTSLAGEPLSQLNVMPTPHKFWRNDKTIEFSRLSQFGLTSQLLTAVRGKELLMSYLAVFRVRTLARPVQVQESTVSEAGCGPTWRGSFARYDPSAASSWRTAQCSLLGDSDEFSETWPRWGSMRNGVSYLRPTPALPICESASGLWPTPKVYGNHNQPGASKSAGWGLSSAVKLLPTPLARDGKSGRFSAAGRAKRDRQSRGKPLSEVIGGPLNPPWVEWLMGWPVGWTELKPLEMDKFHEWQQQHGKF